MAKRTTAAVIGSALVALSLSAQAQKTPQEPLVNDFDSLDVDKDGVISRQEADDHNVWYHFTAIDKNRDRVLSQEEFITYIVEEEPLLGEELELSELPQAYLRERTQDDADVVTNPELMPKIHSEFGDLDANENGFISRDEARGDQIHRHFSHIDSNNDSRLSFGEYENYLEEYGTLVATESLVEKMQF